MPIDVMTQVFYDGLDSVPWIANLLPVVRPVAPYAAALILLRWYFSGAKNPHERVMNSRVVMVTVLPPPSRHSLPIPDKANPLPPRAAPPASANPS